MRVQDTYDAAAEAAADPAHAEALLAAGWPMETLDVSVDRTSTPRLLRFPAPTPGAGRDDRAVPVEVLWYPALRRSGR